MGGRGNVAFICGNGEGINKNSCSYGSISPCVLKSAKTIFLWKDFPGINTRAKSAKGSPEIRLSSIHPL